MTDKEKLEKIKELADAMYYAAGNLGPNVGSGERLRKTMGEYHKFIINEYHKEEPVREKKCMFTKDNYTDEDRKVLCEGCEEECRFNKKEESVSEIDFEQELYKYFGQVKDFTLGMRIAKKFYEIGRNYQDPVSEDLERAAGDYEHNMWKEGHPEDTYNSSDIIKAVKFGAQWKEQQLMAKAVDAQCFGFQGDALFSFKLPAKDYLVGSKVRVIVIKEG